MDCVAANPVPVRDDHDWLTWNLRCCGATESAVEEWLLMDGAYNLSRHEFPSVGTPQTTAKLGASWIVLQHTSGAEGRWIPQPPNLTSAARGAPLPH